MVRISSMQDRAKTAAGEPHASTGQLAQDVMRRPLQGVRVIDFTHVLAGPYCTTILADLGADVVKIERLGVGDVCRQSEPFREGESYYFAGLNRNKRSVALDLKRDSAKRAVEQLIKQADVVVENFRPGTLESLGLGPDRLHELNSRLVICSISGFGQSGPLRNQASFDLVAQAMTGIMGLTGEAGRPPVRAGMHIGDILTAVYGALSVASALIGREKSGRGCVIDLSLFDSLITTFPHLATRYLADGDLFGPVGSGDPSTVPWGAFPAADGYITIAVYGDHFWQLLCRCIGRPELAADATLATNAGRVQRRQEIDSVLREALNGKSVAEWCELFAAAGIPHGPVLSMDAALDHPHTRARGLIIELEHHKCGKVKTVGTPININGAPISASAKAGPMLGEHTEQVLKEICYDDAMIERLRAEGAIAP
ncbi:CoA transferase [Bradyrhizobium sp. 174]|uniref:CaiB/BaiF CoA transferase family protein n=1 Tax=Bradyrhizobium sp. 174 TaxID=2782645 RepID=UPI001FF7E85B|nr:CoA transferase [Bradyrhizobium sp. 174]MCK1571212.1 CoA transferase [Bradyrhizobium sp. 174]